MEDHPNPPSVLTVGSIYDLKNSLLRQEEFILRENLYSIIRPQPLLFSPIDEPFEDLAITYVNKVTISPFLSHSYILYQFAI